MELDRKSLPSLRVGGKFSVFSTSLGPQFEMMPEPRKGESGHVYSHGMFVDFPKAVGRSRSDTLPTVGK